MLLDDRSAVLIQYMFYKKTNYIRILLSHINQIEWMIFLRITSAHATHHIRLVREIRSKTRNLEINP